MQIVGHKDKGKDNCTGKGKDKDKKINMIQGRLQRRGRKAMTRAKKTKRRTKKDMHDREED